MPVQNTSTKRSLIVAPTGVATTQCRRNDESTHSFNYHFTFPSEIKCYERYAFSKERTQECTLDLLIIDEISMVGLMFWMQWILSYADIETTIMFPWRVVIDDRWFTAAYSRSNGWRRGSITTLLGLLLLGFQRHHRAINYVTIELHMSTDNRIGGFIYSPLII